MAHGCAGGGGGGARSGGLGCALNELNPVAVGVFDDHESYSWHELDRSKRRAPPASAQRRITSSRSSTIIVK